MMAKSKSRQTKGLVLRNLAYQLMLCAIVATAFGGIITVLMAIAYLFGWENLEWSAVAWFWLMDGLLAAISHQMDKIGMEMFLGRGGF